MSAHVGNRRPHSQVAARCFQMAFIGDMQRQLCSLHLGYHLSGSHVQGGHAQCSPPEVEHPAPEIADVLRVHLAEVAEIVLAHKVRRGGLHGLDVQVAMLQDGVFVFPPSRTEPAPGTAPCEQLPADAVVLHSTADCCMFRMGLQG